MNSIKEQFYREELKNDEQLLFHGAKTTIEGVIRPDVSRHNNDFGQGFYMGESWKGKTGKDFDNNFIFIQLENGSRMDVDTPTHRFKKAIENYNSACTKEEDKLPLIHLHELRHTSATLLLANHVDIETVSHRLGHSKPSITLDVYGHWMEETDRTASDTLENLFKQKTAI